MYLSCVSVVSRFRVATAVTVAGPTKRGKILQTFYADADVHNRADQLQIGLITILDEKCAAICFGYRILFTR